MIRFFSDRRIRAGIVLAAMPAFACTSSSEMEGLRSQLQEIHFELLELRKQGPTKAELEALKIQLTLEMERLLSSQGNVEREVVALAGRIQQLETKLDETTFRLTQLSQQIAATNLELQAVRSEAEMARVAPAPPPPVAPTSPTDPQALYENAYNDYTRGSYDLAILGFRQYLESYPGTDLADNAVYWMGECYFNQEKFDKAIDLFDDVLTRYEDSERSPSARLRKGFAHLRLARRDEGVEELQNVICMHAGTDEARLARQRLNTLGIDVDCEAP